eukprot:2750716-Lingulodinium_polyedra.AAC.2
MEKTHGKSQNCNTGNRQNVIILRQNCQNPDAKVLSACLAFEKSSTSSTHHSYGWSSSRCRSHSFITTL